MADKMHLKAADLDYRTLMYTTGQPTHIPTLRGIPEPWCLK